MGRTPLSIDTLKARGTYRGDRHAARGARGSRRRELPPGGLCQLCLSGRDWFRDGFGDGPEGMAAMREAWADEEVRRRVFEYQAERNAHFNEQKMPWAALAFGVDNLTSKGCA